MNPTAAEILKRYDRTPDAAAVAVGLNVSASYVYSVLREHRPNRARKAHPKRSDIPARIRKMHADQYSAAEIAEELDVSRAYVYRHLPRGRDGAVVPACPVPHK